MLYRKFELIPIKIGFLQILKVAQELGQRPYTISSKMKRREFEYFLMHIHVLMLCRKFELIPIKI